MVCLYFVAFFNNNRAVPVVGVGPGVGPAVAVTSAPTTYAPKTRRTVSSTSLTILSYSQYLVVD